MRHGMIKPLHVVHILVCNYTGSRFPPTSIHSMTVPVEISCELWWRLRTGRHRECTVPMSCRNTAIFSALQAYTRTLLASSCSKETLVSKYLEKRTSYLKKFTYDYFRRSTKHIDKEQNNSITGLEKDNQRPVWNVSVTFVVMCSLQLNCSRFSKQWGNYQKTLHSRQNTLGLLEPWCSEEVVLQVVS